MATVTTGKRKLNGKVQVISYNGRESLLMLLEEAAESFFNLLDEAGAKGWVEPNFLPEFDVSLSHLVIKHDIPQS